MGGGGGGDPGASARAMEADRQARITAATEQINAIFNNKVAQKSKRYRQNIGNTPAYLSPQEYAARNAELAAQQARRNAEPTFRVRPPVQGGWSNEEYNQLGRAQMVAQPPVQTATGFNPAAWAPEEYDVWVDGDPANGRDAMYQAQRDAVYKLNTMDVDRQAREAERMNRFGLARSGLLGGSADVDSKADIHRMTNEGLMRAGGIADQAAANLQMADERTRGNLISMAQSGIDTGTAQQMALQGLAANAADAKSASASATVGNLFDGLTQAYMNNVTNQGFRAGLQNTNQQWQPGMGGVSGNFGGRVSR